MITQLANLFSANLTKEKNGQPVRAGRKIMVMPKLTIYNIVKLPLAIIFLLFSISGIQAGVIAEYAVSTGNSGSATTTAANTTNTSLTRGSQAIAPGSACTYGFSSTTSGTGFTSSTLNANAYISFTVKPNPCYSLSLSDLAVGIRSSGTGPKSCEIDYSLDGGSTWTTGKSGITPSTSSCMTSTTSNTLGNFTFPSSTTAGSINGIIVKIYGWGATSSGGTFQQYQIDLNGSVNYAPPTPAITGTLSACLGSKLVYRTTKVTGDSYAWTVTGGTVSGSSSLDSCVITWGSTGTYSIQVVETNTAGGCKDSSIKTVIVNARPTPAIVTSDTILCTGTSGSYKTTNVSGDSYSWTATGGTVTSGAGTATVTVKWTTANSANKIKVVETNSNGCKDSSTKIVNVSRPTPAITGDANVCVGSSGNYKVTSVSGDTYTWSSTGGSISSGSGTSAIAISWSSAGTYTVKVVEANTYGCKDSSTFTVKIGSPTPSTSGDTTVCSASNGTYKTTSITGDTYKWTATGGTITSGTGTATITVNWPSAGAYTVKVVEANPLGGCKDSSTMSVHVLGRPSPSVISSDTILCTNIIGTYKTTSVSGDAYKWSSVGGIINSGATTETATISWATSGTYTLKVVETNARGCKDSSTKAVKVSRPKPVMTANLTICTGNSGAYSVSNVSGDTYVWSTTGGTIGSGAGTAAININWPIAGTYSVKVVETNPSGCSDSATVTVNVSRPKPIILTSDTVLCKGVSGTYKTTNVTGDTYKWTLSGGTITSGTGTATIIVSWPVSGTYTVKVVETNASGCKDSSTLTVKVSRPTPSVSGDATVCTGTIGTYKTTSVTGDTYVWSSTSGSVTSGAGTGTITINWPTAGTFTVKVVETNASGCKDSSTFSVKVTRPTPLSTGDTLVCAGSNGSYKTTNVTGDTYKWTSTGGTITSGAGTAAIVINYPSAGTYSIKVVETNTASGCKDSSAVNVRVIARPTPSISGNAIICTGTNGTYQTANVSGDTYKWTSTGGTITSGAGTQTINISWPTAGTYSVKVVETNSYGCKDSSTFSVNVSRPKPVMTADQIICTGNNGTYKVTNASGDTYQWTTTGGTISSGAGTATINISWPTAGTYTVKVVETNTNGCKDSASVTVNVSRPKPIVISTDSIPCTGTGGTYKTTSISGDTYQWTVVGGAINSGAGTASINVSWYSAGTNMVKVVETNSNGCKDSSTYTVKVSRPTPNIIGDANVCAGSTGSYKTTSVSGDTYQWISTGGTITSGAGSGIISIYWPDSGVYSVKIVETNTNGCKDSSTISVKIGKPSPSAIGDSIICTGTSETYKTPNISGNSYIWTATGGTISSGANTSTLVVSWSSAGTYSVKVVESNAGGCKDSSTMTVKVSRPTPALISSDTVLCMGNSGLYKTAAVSGDTYQWTATGGTITSGSATSAINVNWPTAGIYKVKVVETNVSGCKDSSTIIVKVSKPTPAISGDAVICTGTNGNYKTATASGDTYKWTATGGTITSGAGTSNISVNWPTAGSYTVKVVEANASGCKDSSTFVVNVSRPKPYANGDTIICTGISGNIKTASVSGDTYKWTTTGGTITSGAGTNAISLSWPTAGTYKVKVVETNTNGCKDSSTATIIVSRPKPTITVSSSDTIVCTNNYGNYKTTSISGDTYKWTATGGTIASGSGTGSISVSWPSAGAYKVKVVETNVNGCKDSSTVNVKVSRPTPSASGDVNVCTGTSGNYKLAATVSGDAYKWSTTSGTITSGAGTGAITISWPTAGTYTVKVVETNASGCKDSSTVTVNVGRPKPLISGDTIVCTGNNGNYSTAGASGDSYTWTTTNGSVTSGAGSSAITVNWPKAGTYKVKVVETNVYGCKDSNTITVKINRPTPVIHGDSNVCTGTTGAYRIASASGDTYKWRAVGGTIISGANTSSIVVSWPSAGTYAVKVVEANVNGCKDSSIMTINIGRPTPVLSGDTIVCAGNTGAYKTANISSDKYTWYATGGTVSSGAGTSSVIVNWPTSGTYQLKLVETNTGGCKDSSVISVNVSKPTPRIVGDSIVCTGSNGTYKTAKVIGNTYQWYAIGGTVNSGATTASVTVKWPTAGAYSLKVVETNANGCKDSSTFTVKVSKPAPSIIGNTAICTTGSSSFAYSVASVSGDSYAWSSTGGTITSGAGTNAISLNWTSNGTYTVKVVETNGSGCKDSSVISVNVDRPIPAIRGNKTVCTGTIASYASKGVAGHSYSWISSGGSIVTGANTDSITINWATAGNYTVKIIETSTNGCKDSNIINVNVSWPTPVLKGSTDVCALTGVTYKTTAVSGDTYAWTVVGGTITAGAGTEMVSVNWNSTGGSNSITVRETNNQGCSANSSLTVNVNPVPVASWTSTNTTGRSYTFVADNKSYTHYVWNFGDGTSDSSGTTVSHTYAADGTYNVKLTVTSAKGCISSNTVSMNVKLSGINIPVAQQGLGLSVYPNPFSSATNISYTLDNAAMVSLRIYNIDGRLVQTVEEGQQLPGEHHYTVIGDNKLPAGVYILQMMADQQTLIRRMVRLQ